MMQEEIYTYVRDRKGGNRFHCLGVDYGSQCRIIYENEHYMVWKVGGVMTWSGVGSTSYYEVHYLLLRKLEDSDMGKPRAKKISEVQPGKNWRKVKADLIAKADALSAAAILSGRGT